ncbi:MAG: glycosyltransferase family 4 protein [Candidatus Methanomethylicia archaeon]
MFLKEPIIENAPSGPRIVAQKLLKYLSKKIKVILYPRITYLHDLSRAKDIINRLILSYGAIVNSEIDLMHFITIPYMTDFTVESITLLGRLRKIPIVINIHGIVYKNDFHELKRHVLKNKLAFISHIKATNSDKIVVNSYYMKNVLSIYYKIPQNKVVVIPNGVDIEEFTPLGDKIYLEGDPAILYAGRISWEKGIDILIKAIPMIKKDLKKAKFHIVGSGPWTNEIILLAKKLNAYPYIKFHGSFPYRYLPYIFRGADIFVLPSRVEPFGMVLLEAMACGLPVVASSVGGIPEIIKHYKNGILITPNNPTKLCQAITEIYLNNSLNKKLSSNAIQTASKYSWENIADIYLRLYKQLTMK